MLVLSRKAGQTIHIGNDIELTITQIRGNRVGIGIQAPDDVIIVRGELTQTIKPTPLAQHVKRLRAA